MSNEELKLRCLELAVKQAGMYGTNILETAFEFYKFCKIVEIDKKGSKKSNLEL